MKHRMNLLIIFICTTVIVMTVWYDLLPLQQELVISTRQEKQLRQQLQKLYYQENSLTLKMAKLPETNHKLNEWQKKFIKYKDMNKLLKEIKAMTKREELTMEYLTPPQMIKENNYNIYSYKLNLVGNYNQITQFLSHIASLPWTVVIGDFSLTKLWLTSEPIYSINLMLNVYTLSTQKT